MKIERVILIFKKTQETVFKEINADGLKLSLIKKLFKAFDDDPNFYRPYKINQIQYDELIKHNPELKLYPCTKFDLYLEAYSV
ncbi:MAG: hypothetical protein ABI723_21705 [Bacteroidia bacterium]